MGDYIIINQKILPAKKALISVEQRGFLFGDGVFETCRINDGIIEDWNAHKTRLQQALKAIKINITDSKINDFENLAKKLIKKNNQIDGILRIYVSRGIGSVGYLPIAKIKPLIVIETKSLPERPKEPVNLWLSKITKPSLSSLPINYKLAQGLNSILARMEAQENGCFDALMLNDRGEICETSSANIFWRKNNILYTPAEECGILLGITRQKIIDSSNCPIKLVRARLSELDDAKEIFITNCVFGILEVKEIRNWELGIGN